MDIVDSQVHLWAAESASRPWPPGRAAEAQKPYQILKETLLFQMDLAGVRRMVLVPPSWEGDRNDMALEAARSYPDRFAVMGRLALQDPASRALVADWRKQPGMLGMRFTFHTPVLRQPLLDGKFDWVWGEMEKGGIPAMVLFHHEYMHLADKVAERYPGLRLVLDHLGLKSGKDVTEATNFATLDNVLVLARRPNVAAKVTAMPCYAADKAYPFKSVHPYIKSVFESFGPKRTFWGTDWSRLPCSYRQGVTMFTEEMPWLKGQDLDWVMGRGVCEWLGWKV